MVFQFRVEIDPEPLFTHQAFKEQKTRIGCAITASAVNVMADQDSIVPVPVDRIIVFIHEFVAVEVLDGTGECEIGKT